VAHQPAFSVCRSLDFHERRARKALADKVAAVLDIIREKYKEYGIDETPSSSSRPTPAPTAWA
jgi:glutamate--cysteine ligase